MIDIYANIDEADVGRLKPGQPVTFTVNAYPNRTFQGRVELVRLGAQTIQNVVTYTGVVRVQNRDMALLPGMTANLQIVTEDRRDVLRVPNAALRFRPAGSATTPAAASPGETGPAQRGGAALRERLETELKPTPEQLAAIDAALSERRGGGGRSAMAGLSEEERRATFRAARQETFAKIAAALDPERRAKFEALMRETAENRGQNAAPGRVYVLDGKGEPQAKAIRLGPSDGAYTELVGGGLKEGEQVVTGGGPRATAAAEPAAPRGPRGPRLF